MSTAPIKRQRIAIFPGHARQSEGRLFDSLADLFPVDFVEEDQATLDGIDGAVVFSEQRGLAQRLFERGIRSLLFDSATRASVLPASGNATIGNHPTLHAAFRNARIPNAYSGAIRPVFTGDRDVILASDDSLKLWVARFEGHAELHTTAIGPPHLEHDEWLWSCLKPGKWLHILPLFHFLRRITADNDWSSPAQRGCFIFDDPNLHSTRYGYLDFAELAVHASEHQYHAAIATVPFDAWYAAPAAAELFRRQRSRLSLLIHGNDHLHHELARVGTETQALRLLAQALTRIARLERKTGLAVSRVMAAPHGACSESMMEHMLRVQLEGACISPGSLSRWNPHKNWRLAFGLLPVCDMAGGFPVLHRFAFPGGLVSARFAAFLGQPIIPYGHHGDCAGGLGPLAEIADAVNSWAPTMWTDFAYLFRGHYRTRTEGDLLHVQMCTRRAEVSIPSGVAILVIHAGIGNTPDVEISMEKDDGDPQICSTGQAVAVEAGSTLRLSFKPRASIDLNKISKPPYRAWPTLRRALTIGRDRLQPAFRAAHTPGRDPALENSTVAKDICGEKRVC